MQSDYIEKKYIYEYIKDKLNDFKITYEKINNAKYHHNTDYISACSIVKYGILSMNHLHKLGLKYYSKELFNLFTDETSHINGVNGISLSIPYLSDLYGDEFEYDPFDKSKVDFVIDNSVKAVRNTINYGNEYITYDSITSEKIKAIDIRLIEYLGYLMSKKDVTNTEYEQLIRKYNSLIFIALNMKNANLDIPFREKSFKEKSSLDVSKVANAKILKLTK